MTNKELLANLSQDFYLSRLTLAELSAKYDLSRYLVNKYLDEARQTGVVNIFIKNTAARNLDLEKQMKNTFNIKHVYVLKNIKNPADNLDNIISYSASKIENYISHSHTVGTSWGSTMFNVIEHFQDTVKDDVKFTQFMGENMRYTSDVGSMRMVEKAAAKFSSSYITMVGPLYIVDDNTRKGMKNEIASKDAFMAASRMDLIFTGLGTLASINSIPSWRDNITSIFPNVELNKIAGVIYGRPYDIDGHFLNLENDKTFGIDLETILNTPVRFGVISNRFKTDAALGALRGEFLTDIVLSETVANKILISALDEIE